MKKSEESASNNSEIKTKPATPIEVVNSSRDYFKNFNVETYCNKIDANLQTSFEIEPKYEIDHVELRKTVREVKQNIETIRRDIAELSSISTDSSPVNKRRDLPTTTPRQTPNFVFIDNTISTELHKQVELNNIDSVLKLLLDKTNDINYRDQNGMTPLHLAIRKENIKITETRFDSL